MEYKIILTGLGIYLVSETLVAFLFSLLAQLTYKRIGFDIRSIVKGIVERLFLVLCLANGFYTGLTLFGALKLATRLKIDDQKINDYYLLGNLFSVIVAIGYTLLIFSL